MSRKLTVLMTPLDCTGCFNPCIGIGQELIGRGHKVVFAVPDSWKNKLSPQGFVEEWLTPEEPKAVDEVQVWGEIVNNLKPIFLLSPEEQIKGLVVFYEAMINQVKDTHLKLQRVIAKVRPDIIITDTFFHQPAVMESGIPWILTVSINPLGVSSENSPPAFSGYPTGIEHKKKWENYMVEYETLFQETFDDFKEWVVQNGGPTLEFSQPFFSKFSPYANIYMTIEELDYTNLRPNPPNFHRFDTFIRKSPEIFQVPENLKNKPGKLVYFSMGTIGCAEVELIRRIVSILAKSPHRFIISKGPLGHTYELPGNMWGAKSLPQTEVLPLVDLVITHGGNNTVTESIYFGKPLIILPLFGDQPDNAQRVMESGLGIRFHPYKVTEQELLGAIEKLLGDEELGKRLKNISKRIQGANNLGRVSDLIEKIAK